ncbi:MAG: metal ABC transporter solute-binding protein, Zn/Mn family, partial [Acidimicrobiales bacterium]
MRRGWAGRRLPAWRAVAVAAVAATALGSTSCSAIGAGASPAPARGVVRVVAAEDMWGNIASQLGGAHVAVVSLVNSPNADPHLFEATAADAAAVALAQVVILNGANYDPWMAALTAAGGAGPRRIVEAARVLGLGGPRVNPHIWYATARLPEVARAIEGALGRVDPSARRYFSERLRAFERSLRPLLAVMSRIRAGYGGTRVAVTEPLPGYLLEEAGLVSATPVSFALAVENGVEPSPADTERLDSLMAGHRVAALIVNSQTVSAVTSGVAASARRAGVPIVAMTETLPARLGFQDWQLSQDEALLAALRRSKSGE